MTRSFTITSIEPKWNVGGEFYQMYDLELECDDVDDMDLDEDEDSGDSLNTSDDRDGIEDDDGLGDGVFLI